MVIYQLIDKHWTLNILTWLSLGYNMFGVNQQGSKKVWED